MVSVNPLRNDETGVNAAVGVSAQLRRQQCFRVDRLAHLFSQSSGGSDRLLVRWITRASFVDVAQVLVVFVLAVILVVVFVLWRIGIDDQFEPPDAT